MKNFLAAPICALMLTAAIGTAAAQQGSPMMNQSGSGMMGGQNGDQGDNQSQSMPGPFHGWRGMMPWGYGNMGPGMMSGRGWGNHMMGSGMMGSGMMGSGMMMGRMMGPEMMIVMMDTNEDGQLSLEEFQAVHSRMFKLLDKDGDGQLTTDEIQKRWSQDDEND